MLPEHDPSQFLHQLIGDMTMKQVFDLAKSHKGMPVESIDKLLKHDNHMARVGAVSIMDFDARDAKVSNSRKEELYNLYINRHAYINTWDLVDRAAPYVVGGYLFDKPRDILYKLAKSDQPMERRSAITATYYFIRQNDLTDTFKIADLLAEDDNELVQKAVGGWIREAGKKDAAMLLDFLESHAAQMPRTMLTYAIEKLTSEQKSYYRSLH
jgi:3-methyladenine DNA glycosylase AlkD